MADEPEDAVVVVLGLLQAEKVMETALQRKLEVSKNCHKYYR